jgi:uncharacterized protein YndB with AHSA1/START domain
LERYKVLRISLLLHSNSQKKRLPYQNSKDATPYTLKKPPITFFTPNSKEEAMAAISYTIDINAPAKKVFDVVTDLQSYAEWLPDSASFKGTTEVSESPVKLGTTYIESTPSGIRNGKVLEFEPPSKVVFHQPMKLNPVSKGLLVDIRVEVTLTEKGGVTTVERNVYLGLPEPLLPGKTAWEEGAAAEGARTMTLLKQRVESLQ